MKLATEMSLCDEFIKTLDEMERAALREAVSSERSHHALGPIAFGVYQNVVKKWQEYLDARAIPLKIESVERDMNELAGGRASSFMSPLSWMAKRSTS